MNGLIFKCCLFVAASVKQQEILPTELILHTKFAMRLLLIVVFKIEQEKKFSLEFLVYQRLPGTLCG